MNKSILIIGGGPANTLSLPELIDIIAGLTGERPKVSYGPWRAAGRRYCVSDAGKFESVTGWRALYGWLSNRNYSAPSRLETAR